MYTNYVGNISILFKCQIRCAQNDFNAFLKYPLYNSSLLLFKNPEKIESEVCLSSLCGVSLLTILLLTFCLYVFDRAEWERILEKNKWNEVDIRDNRYNQVIHLLTAAR